MNTLPRAITARFFPTPDSYNSFRKHWSDLINSERKHELTAAHHLLHLALIGKDWRRAFTPISNQRKLDNGAFWGWRMFDAMFKLHSKFSEEELLAPFDGLATPQMLQDLRVFLPLVYPSNFQAAEFVKASFPFEAYKDLPPASENSGETSTSNE